MTAPLLVTGASGQLGRRVLDRLLAQHAGPVIATTRKPDSLADFAARGVEVRRADFNDPASLAQAFRGAGRALLISTDDLADDRRLAQHTTAVAAFEAAGVGHVVYTSLFRATASSISFAPEHAGTEAALAASKLDFTILRNNIYTDMIHAWLPAALATGKLINARGDGGFGFITRDDCAQIAATTLAAGDGRRTFEITGPESVTSADLVTLAHDVLGRTIEHVRVPLDAVIRGLTDHGLPPKIAAIFASIDTAVARGELGHVTDDAARILGHRPTSIRDYLTANRAAFA